MSAFIRQIRLSQCPWTVPPFCAPQAIKYNKVFVDGYWNSREQSFAQHLFRLMTSWAVVCDVWFLGALLVLLHL